MKSVGSGPAAGIGSGPADLLFARRRRPWRVNGSPLKGLLLKGSRGSFEGV